ncbi:hypothetical protein FIM25_10175 [Desulfobotulus mexicanus]|uniref:Uncharacterized protein n=1 Tax=Desulfobotulus mexicanus TaxID=2586642 RepID=A0A5S5MF64_9BACT|nr:hypothetical protein [Desulfobotulus mexicanus]TYT74319.1 hypothetical protein FIM25_10175 [Desulfobotulus mexicanus]
MQNVSRKLLMENAEDLTQKAINLAMDGDTTALSLCLNRIMPALKSCSPLIEVDTEGAGNMADRGLKIIDAATSGQLAPDLAGQLLQALGTLARIDELEDLRDRLTAIEDAMKQRKKETRT